MADMEAVISKLQASMEMIGDIGSSCKPKLCTLTISFNFTSTENPPTISCRKLFPQQQEGIVTYSDCPVLKNVENFDPGMGFFRVELSGVYQIIFSGKWGQGMNILTHLSCRHQVVFLPGLFVLDRIVQLSERAQDQRRLDR